MSEQVAYSRRALELQAAEYYVSIRKPESEWRTIEDLTPQLAEYAHRIKAGDFDRACQILESIDYAYLFKWGYYKRLTQLWEPLKGKLNDLDLKIVRLQSLGRCYRELGQRDHAGDLLKPALEMARQSKSQEYEVSLLDELGLTCRVQGDTHLAIVFYLSSLQMARDLGIQWAEYARLGSLGRAQFDLGQFEEAFEKFTTALSLARKNNDQWEEELNLGRIGRWHCAYDRYAEAVRYFQEARDIAKETRPSDKYLHLVCLSNAYRHLGQIERASELYQQEMTTAYQETDSPWLKSILRVEYGRIQLEKGQISEAYEQFEAATQLDSPETMHEVWISLYIAALRLLKKSQVKDCLDKTIEFCQDRLTKTSDLYAPRYVLATALVGKATCDPHWTDSTTQRTTLLEPALTEYRRALDITSAPGIVRDALCDLKLIRAAGIEGLEPVFELLEGALNEQR